MKKKRKITLKWEQIAKLVYGETDVWLTNLLSDINLRKCQERKQLVYLTFMSPGVLNRLWNVLKLSGVWRVKEEHLEGVKTSYRESWANVTTSSL